ncbi:hypothetical protein [Streptomyces griseorubiginosus]
MASSTRRPSWQGGHVTRFPSGALNDLAARNSHEVDVHGESKAGRMTAW